MAPLQKPPFLSSGQSLEDHVRECRSEKEEQIRERGLESNFPNKPTNLLDPKPAECIRCFSPNISVEKDYDSWRCTCLNPECGHMWDERLAFAGQKT